MDCDFKVHYYLIDCNINGTIYKHVEIVKIENLNGNCTWGMQTKIKMAIYKIIHQNMLNLNAGYWRFVMQACWEEKLNLVSGLLEYKPCDQGFDNCCTVEMYSELGDCNEPVISIIAQRKAWQCREVHLGDQPMQYDCWYVCDLYDDLENYSFEEFQVLFDLD